MPASLLALVQDACPKRAALSTWSLKDDPAFGAVCGDLEEPVEHCDWAWDVLSKISGIQVEKLSEKVAGLKF